MKILAVLLLVGFALASAVPVPSHDLSLHNEDDLEYILNFALNAEDEDDGPQTELGKKLKEHLDKILEQIRDAIDHGKTVKEETLDKLKQIRDKLKELNEDLGKKTKDFIEKLKEKAKDYWRDLLDRLGLKDANALYTEALFADDDTETDTAKELRDKLNDILAKIKEAIDHGKGVKDDIIEKLKELKQKLKDIHVDIGAKAKELLQRIKDHLKDRLKEILEKLGIGKRAALMHAEHLSQEFVAADDDVVNKLRERFEEIINKIKDAINNGGNIKEWVDKLKQLREELKGKGDELGNKFKEAIEKLKEKVKDYFKNLLDKIGQGEEVAHGRIRDKLKELKDKMGRGQRLPDFRELLRNLRDRIKEGIDGDKLKDKIEELFGKGSVIAEQLINKLKEKGDSWKEKILNFIDRILGDNDEKRSIHDFYEKIKEYLRNFKIELKEKFLKFGEWAKEQYEKGLKEGKDRMENLRNLAKRYIEDAKNLSKEALEQGREFFEEYKNDLGEIYKDVQAKIKEILNKNKN